MKYVEKVEDIIAYYQTVFDKKSKEPVKKGEETALKWIVRCAATNAACAHAESGNRNWWMDKYYNLKRECDNLKETIKSLKDVQK